MDSAWCIAIKYPSKKAFFYRHRNTQTERFSFTKTQASFSKIPIFSLKIRIMDKIWRNKKEILFLNFGVIHQATRQHLWNALVKQTTPFKAFYVNDLITLSASLRCAQLQMNPLLFNVNTHFTCDLNLIACPQTHHTFQVIKENIWPKNIGNENVETKK